MYVMGSSGPEIFVELKNVLFFPTFLVLMRHHTSQLIETHEWNIHVH